LIFITNVELTDSVKKRFGLRRSYKLLWLKNYLQTS
jgi:hypothetical protein